MPEQAGQVIVGVSNSLAGLRALREAVWLARRRGVELLAVRTFHRPFSEIGSGYRQVIELGAEAAPPRSEGYREWAAHERAAEAAVERAFEEAMGGVPADVPVRAMTKAGPPGLALVDATSREDDLLVVGASRRHRWWPLHRCIARYCSTRAGCPVLVVPPHDTARDLQRGRLRRWLWRRRKLSNLTAEFTPLSRPAQ
jgi:nucleotide-binding universal stress UspA family protein